MDDEPRVRRQRAGLLVGCATLPMSEPHRHPHGRLRKLKNRLKTSRSAREPHRAATSLAMARPAPALDEALRRAGAARSPPLSTSRYFGKPMVDTCRPWVPSTGARLTTTHAQPSALQPMGSRSLFSTTKATKMVVVLVVLEGVCSFLTAETWLRKRPRPILMDIELHAAGGYVCLPHNRCSPHVVQSRGCQLAAAEAAQQRN